MQIVVTHLTRMAYPYICVAGLDTRTGRHVRPTLYGRLGREWADNGGHFQLGAQVDLGQARHVGQPPEIEDYRFEPHRIRRLEAMPPERFWEALTGCAEESLAAVFGPELEAVRQTFACDEGHGAASLGCVRPAATPELFISDNGNLRLRVQLDGAERLLPVTDRRCYRIDAGAFVVAEEVAGALQARLADQEEVLLTVGLTRPRRLHEHDPRPRHWLQVNNLHLAGTPLWTPMDLTANSV
jgi:hypothetical protein